MNTRAAEINAPALRTPINREQLLPSHPVITRKFTIPTPPLKRAVQTMVHLIASGAPHGVWVAPPRIGKTWATQYSEQCLAEAFPALPIFRYISRWTQLPKERDFYTDLLTQLGAGPTKSTVTPSACLHVVVRRMFAAAQEKGSSSVLFIGDEMQKFNEHKFLWLIDVGNELQRLGVRMIVILFGQQELLHIRTALLSQQRVDILGRFLSRSYTFHGIRSAAELGEVMQGYDDASVRDYPAGSGVSFTEFFLPLAYQAGWRLAGEAMTAWDQFEQAAKVRLTHAQVEQLSIGMEWVAAAIQHILTHQLEFDAARFRLRPADWRQAIAMSGFESSLPFVYVPAAAGDSP